MRTKREYQEALEELEDYIVETIIDDGVLSINHFNEQIKLLQELIDNLKENDELE